MKQEKLDRVRVLWPLLLKVDVVIIRERAGDQDAFVVQSKQLDHATQGPTRQLALSAFAQGFVVNALMLADAAYGMHRPCPDDVWSELIAREGAERATFGFARLSE
jgi:hypothetical protein